MKATFTAHYVLKVAFTSNCISRVSLT
ncbi:MAG: hypothetical protein JWQ81_302, partial [Amycolatopsis sp.]|nr:hypothetical protein [Amycolatopsis sp.]